MTAEGEEMTVAPARVHLKTVFRDPVNSGKTGGYKKSYKKKRPVGPASGDEIVAEKKSRITAGGGRPGKKTSTAGGQVKTTKSPQALGPGKSSAPIVHLASSGSESEDGEDTC